MATFGTSLESSLNRCAGRNDSPARRSDAHAAGCDVERHAATASPRSSIAIETCVQHARRTNRDSGWGAPKAGAPGSRTEASRRQRPARVCRNHTTTAAPPRATADAAKSAVRSRETTLGTPTRPRASNVDDCHAAAALDDDRTTAVRGDRRVHGTIRAGGAHQRPPGREPGAGRRRAKADRGAIPADQERAAVVVHADVRARVARRDDLLRRCTRGARRPRHGKQNQQCASTAHVSISPRGLRGCGLSRRGVAALRRRGRPGR